MKLAVKVNGIDAAGDHGEGKWGGLHDRVPTTDLVSNDPITKGFEHTSEKIERTNSERD